MEGRAGTEGLWQLEETLPDPTGGGHQLNDVYAFLYSAGTATLRLVSRHTLTWRSADDVYRLETRWEGDTLFYRPPFAPFRELATFEDGRFINRGSGLVRIFRRIAPSELPEWSRSILNPRPVHDYRIRPDGTLAPDDVETGKDRQAAPGP